MPQKKDRIPESQCTLVTPVSAPQPGCCQPQSALVSGGMAMAGHSGSVVRGCCVGSAPRCTPRIKCSRKFDIMFCPPMVQNIISAITASLRYCGSNQPHSDRFTFSPHVAVLHCLVQIATSKKHASYNDHRRSIDGVLPGEIATCAATVAVSRRFGLCSFGRDNMEVFPGQHHQYGCGQRKLWCEGARRNSISACNSLQQKAPGIVG